MLDIFLLFCGGLAAGAFGALFGLGGGVLMVPLLVVALHIPIHNAIATSLLTVIATSSAATARNVRDGIANLRLGVSLELVTVLGAIAGGAIAGLIPPRVLMIMFATTVMLLAFMMFRGSEPPPLAEEPADAGFLAQLHASYFDPKLGREVRYGVQRLPLALGVSTIAGTLSGLLGIGGGIVKVPTLSLYCGVPIKAAAATSNFMIGITAMASVVAYFGRGEVLPTVTAASVLGVIAGSRAGLWLAERTHAEVLRRWFGVVMVLIATQMIWKVLH
ncbi:MAG TPA: sulfite exporter TauE/SafE family protein [Thermoanaerobaculia bacterium]